MTPFLSYSNIKGAKQSEPLEAMAKQGAKSPRGKQTATRDIVAEHPQLPVRRPISRIVAKHFGLIFLTPTFWKTRASETR